MTTVIFYLFSAILLFAGFRVITAKNPVHAAMFLILSFFTSAALWLLLEAEFLAITLILVYVGAVMVLFLFVIMMLDINIDVMREGFIRYLPAGAVVAGLVIVEMGMVLGSRYFGEANFPTPAPHGADYSNTKELGEQLYTMHLYSFEIAAAILLIAIVAAIGLTFRRRASAKKQVISEQHHVERKDRIRLLDLPAEEKA